jgi:hypothetical protein
VAGEVGTPFVHDQFYTLASVELYPPLVMCHSAVEFWRAGAIMGA